MSGHSKWSTIKRKKQAADQARGRIFSRLSKEIAVAARLGGGDPDANARLRSAIDAARAENMPNDNIERAIKRGTGELPGVSYEDVTYEGYGPGGVAIMVQTATDNRNRTVSELRKIFETRGGTLGEVNSVAWMFRQVGYFLIDADGVDEDELLGVALEAGAEDLQPQNGSYEVTSPPTQYAAVADALKGAGIGVLTEELAMLPKSYIELEGREGERCLKLMEALEEHDDVQHVWTNADIDQEVLEGAVASG